MATSPFKQSYYCTAIYLLVWTFPGFEADEECIIQEDSKQDILTELREVTGITEAMLFPDFDGFARLRSEGIPYVQILILLDYRERGSELYQRGEYEQLPSPIMMKLLI